MSDRLELIVLSFACCNPSMEPYDNQFLSRIMEAMNKTQVAANVEVLPITEALMGRNINILLKIKPLFEKYGMAIAPVLLVNDELALYGGVPSVEKIAEVLVNHYCKAVA